MSQFYFDPERANEKWSLPDGEAFYAKAGEWDNDDGEPCEAGWYWWSCVPGCMPDSEATGPFETEQEAVENAREWF